MDAGQPFLNLSDSRLTDSISLQYCRSWTAVSISIFPDILTQYTIFLNYSVPSLTFLRLYIICHRYLLKVLHGTDGIILTFTFSFSASLLTLFVCFYLGSFLSIIRLV